MNDLIPIARVEGQVIYHDQDLYDTKIDPVQVRKRIGMVFQKTNPFPKSIYDNIAFGPRVMGMQGDMNEIVENALRRRPTRSSPTQTTSGRRTTSPAKLGKRTRMAANARLHFQEELRRLESQALG